MSNDDGDDEILSDVTICMSAAQIEISTLRCLQKTGTYHAFARHRISDCFIEATLRIHNNNLLCVLVCVGTRMTHR